MAFIADPDSLAALRRTPALVDGAVEEILRWTSPTIELLPVPRRRIRTRRCRDQARRYARSFSIRLRQSRRGRVRRSLCVRYPPRAKPASFVRRLRRACIVQSGAPLYPDGASRTVHRLIAQRTSAPARRYPRHQERFASFFFGGIKRMPVHFRKGMTSGKNRPVADIDDAWAPGNGARGEILVPR